MSSIIEIFPTTIKKTTLIFDNQKLLDYCSKQIFVSTVNEEKLQSYYSDISRYKHILSKEIFKNIRNLILREVNKFTKDTLKYNTEFVETTSWLTRARPFTKSDFHFHYNSFMSAVLYLYASNDTFIINNVNRHGFQCIPFEYNKNNSNEVILKVNTGDLIIFPSHLKHCIGLNKNKEIRYSLAVNFIPIGKFGENDSEVNIKKV